MQRLLLPFLLVAITSVTHAQRPSWVIQETEKNGQWTIESNDILYIYASVNGKVLYGDRLRLTMNGSKDRCRNAVLGMSWYIGSDESNLTDDLEGTVIALEAFGDEVKAKIMFVTEHSDGEKVAWLNIIRTDTAEMEDLLGFMNEYSDRLEMTIKPTSSFRADQIFPVLTNSWTLEGSMKAFGRAKRLCERLVEDTFI